MIRLARIDELPTIFPFMKQFEDATKFVKGNVDYSINKYRAMMAEGRAWILILLDDRGWLQGGLGFIKSTEIHSGDPIAIETFWFVAPRYRGKGVSLLRAYEKLAAELGCNKIAIAHLADSYPDRLERLYEHRGFSLIEKMYLKELPK
jgi:GNAT superfamily N-acetyltransferase